MRRPVWKVVLAAVLVVSMAAPAVAWTTGVADPFDGDSHMSSIAVVRGTLSLAWWHRGTDDLFLSRRGPAGWHTRQVGDVGTTRGCYPKNIGYDHAGPVLGSSPVGGRIGIVSVCPGHAFDVPDRIRWTRHGAAPGQWVTRRIASAPVSAGSGCFVNGVTNVDLAFDPTTGFPNVVFGDVGTHSITWAHYDGSSWTSQPIVSGTKCSPSGPVVSAAFDPLTGHLAVAWNTDVIGTLEFAEFDGSTWDTVTIASQASRVPSLAFAPDGTPWIAYVPYQSGGRGTLSVAVRRSGAWTTAPVDDRSGIDVRGLDLRMRGSQPRIAYEEHTGADLWLATSNGTGWGLRRIDRRGRVGEAPTLAVIGHHLAVASWDSTNRDLRWAES